MRVTRRPTAIVAHPIWGRGGAEAAAMWIIHALTKDFDVTVYTRSGFDLNALNALAGTSISLSEISIRSANLKHKVPIGAFTAGAYVRSLRRIGGEFDLRVSASGAMPWGRKALHFLSSIDWHPNLSSNIQRHVKISLRERLSKMLIAFASGPKRYHAGDVFAANSEWLRAVSREYCSNELAVIHPVVQKPIGESRPWSKRNNAVLVFGRISPEKEIESCIRIVGAARNAGFTGELLIVGPDGDPAYAQEIRKIAEGLNWVKVLPAITGREKSKLLGSVKFGLNACGIEAFGISTAEMAAHGAIVLVPAGTGQGEIVKNPLQQYKSESQAVARLLAFSEDPRLQARLHLETKALPNQFSEQCFTLAVRRLAREASECPRNFATGK